MRLVDCPSVDMIRRSIESFEHGDQRLPLKMAQSFIGHELDVWKPAEKNTSSKITVERDTPVSKLQKHDSYYSNYFGRPSSPKIVVPNEVFCDVLRFKEEGCCFSYRHNSDIWIRDRYMSEALFRSMCFGYIVGRFGFCGTGNALSLSVKEVY